MPFHRLVRFRTFRFIRFWSFRKRWRWTVCGLTFCVFILLFVFRYGLVCTGWQASEAVKALCQLYEAGKVSGNMCNDLCVSGAVILGHCHTYHLSKDVVVAAQWRDKSVVLKAQHANILDYDRPAIDNDITHYPSITDFAHMVRMMLRNNFNVSLGHGLQSDPTLLTYLWSLNFEDVSNSSQRYAAALDSIWSLVQQNEYILFKYFENYNVFPKVFGTCGHIYAVEYIKTQTYSVNNWSSKLAYALNVLKLVTKLQTAFHQPLYLCDLKPEHFGLAASSEIKVIDADTVFFQSVINKMVQNAQPCSNHEECAFWDCKSKCDPKEHRCSHKVLNNNLQMICEHLFLRRTESPWKWLSQPGLLLSTNQDSNILHNLLLECANPSEDEDPGVRAAASNAVLEKLLVFLKNDLINQQTT